MDAGAETNGIRWRGKSFHFSEIWTFYSIHSAVAYFQMRSVFNHVIYMVDCSHLAFLMKFHRVKKLAFTARLQDFGLTSLQKDEQLSVAIKQDVGYVQHSSARRRRISSTILTTNRVKMKMRFHNMYSLMNMHMNSSLAMG